MAALVIAVCGAFFAFLHYYRLSLLQVERSTSFHEQATLITRLVREFFFSPLNSTDLAEIIFPLAAQDKPLDGQNLALLSSERMRASERSVGIITIGSGWRLDMLVPGEDGLFIASQLSADASGRISPVTSYSITPGVAGVAAVEAGMDASLIVQIAQGLQSIHSGGSFDLVVTMPDNHEILVIPGVPVSLPAAKDGTVIRRIPFVTVDKDRLGKLGPQLSVAGTLPVILCMSRSDLNPIILYRRPDVSDSAAQQLCASMDLNLLSPEQTNFTRDVMIRDDAQADQAIKLLCIDVPDKEWKVWAGYDWNAILKRPVAAGETVPESVVLLSFLALCIGGCLLIRISLIVPLRGMQKRMHALRNLNTMGAPAASEEYIFREMQYMSFDLSDIERTMRSLVTYAPDNVTEALLGDASADVLRPRRIGMTVLFIPLPVQTDWLDSPDAFASLERFFVALEETVRQWPTATWLLQHDGICFGWHNAEDKSNLQGNIASAVTAAQIAVTLMERMNRDFAPANKTVVYPSVGIYCGSELFWGTFGTPSRRMHAVIGEGMHAVRVCCELARNNNIQIVCNATVADILRQTNPCRPIIQTEEDLAQALYWEIASGCSESNLIDHHYTLFSDFENARDSLCRGDGETAQHILRKILGDNPEDGLCLNLMRLCQQRISDSSTRTEITRALGQEQPR